MREMMVSSIARYLALGDVIPQHWAKALKKNGELAVDIIRAIQEWHLEERSLPDARDGSVERGRSKVGFSAVEEKQDDAAPEPSAEDSFATDDASEPTKKIEGEVNPE